MLQVFWKGHKRKLLKFIHHIHQVSTKFTLKHALCSGVSPEECKKLFGFAPPFKSSFATRLNKNFLAKECERRLCSRKLELIVFGPVFRSFFSSKQNQKFSSQRQVKRMFVVIVARGLDWRLKK